MKKILEILNSVFLNPKIIVVLSAIILSLTFFILFYHTDIRLFNILGIIFVIYPAILVILSMIFAWIINPIKDLIAWHKNKQKK